MLSGGAALSPNEVDPMIGGYVHAYLHVSPEGFVESSGIMLLGRDKPREKPTYINCRDYAAEDILEVIKGFIRG